MIRHLDLTLKAMLTGEADPGSELKKANISFSIPDEKWQKNRQYPGTGCVSVRYPREPGTPQQ